MWFQCTVLPWYFSSWTRRSCQLCKRSIYLDFWLQRVKHFRLRVWAYQNDYPGSPRNKCMAIQIWGRHPRSLIFHFLALSIPNIHGFCWMSLKGLDKRHFQAWFWAAVWLSSQRGSSPLLPFMRQAEEATVHVRGRSSQLRAHPLALWQKLQLLITESVHVTDIPKNPFLGGFVQT